MTGKAIYSLLSADSGVTAIASTRIFPMVVQQAKGLPAVTYTLIYSDPHDDKDGVSDLDVERWQLSAFANDAATVDSLNLAIRTVLERYSGTVQSVVIQSVRFIGTQDLFEQDVEDRGVYHKATDYSFRIQL